MTNSTQTPRSSWLRRLALGVLLGGLTLSGRSHGSPLDSPAVGESAVAIMESSRRTPGEIRPTSVATARPVPVEVEIAGGTSLLDATESPSKLLTAVIPQQLDTEAGTALDEPARLPPIHEEVEAREPARLPPVDEEESPTTEEVAQPIIPQPVRETLPPPPPPAAPAPPEKIEVDDITLQTPPLVGASQSLIARAARRDKSVPDYSREYFSEQPPIAYGPARSAEGVPNFTGPVAGDFCYRPLYFEEKNLERYGRHWGPVQPIVSGARFFTTVPALPYLMAVNHPRTCYDWHQPYPAGFYAPRVRERPPISIAGATVESSVLLGLIFLIP
jgi:hypothetical protein